MEGTPQGDLYSCSVMIIEILGGKDHILDDKKIGIVPCRKVSKIWKAVTHCEDCSKHSELTAQEALAFLYMDGSL